MNKHFAVTLCITLLDSLALFFAAKDLDTVGQDDRLARILGNAAQELRNYLMELPL